MADNRPTVALVAHAVHDRGGMERAFSELIIRGHGDYRFVVVSAELDDRLRALVEWRRVRVPMRPIPLKLIAFAVLAGLRLRRIRPDLVHSMGAIVPSRVDLATVQFCAAGFRSATGGLAPVGSPPLRRLNTALTRLLGLAFERWSYRPGRTRALAAVSRGVAGELERHYPGITVGITPNGVDAERFRPDPDARRTLRADETLADGDLVCLFVGGDWDRKGLDVAIEALGVAALPSAQLWVVGHGDEQRFAALARNAGVPVRFFGARFDTERFFAAADVFVLPTLYETFSLVAYEAAAAGLPVIATPVSGIAELLEGERAGLLVPREAGTVAAALARLAADPTLRRTMGEAGRERASAYGWGRSVASVLALYTSLLAEAR